jgi:hypothetical protein
MSLPKCAGVINNEYYYLNGSSFLFPNRADPASKTAITDSNIDFIFDHGCVFDGYKSTYLLGISSSDSTNIISYRVSTLEKDNGTISIDKDDKLEFSHIPDFSQQVLFISRNNNADSEWCALYNSNDSDVGNTIWEDCSQTDNPTNITKTSNISNLNTWVAGASNSIIYQLTNTSLSQYNASTSNITHEKTYVLNNEISLTPNSPWSFTVAGYSKLLEFAVTDGVSVQTVSIPVSHKIKIVLSSYKKN